MRELWSGKPAYPMGEVEAEEEETGGVLVRLVVEFRYDDILLNCQNYAADARNR